MHHFDPTLFSSETGNSKISENINGEERYLKINNLITNNCSNYKYNHDNNNDCKNLVKSSSGEG